MRRLICEEGGSSKFWEGRVEGATLTVRFGKLGTAGQTKEKSFRDAASAQKELEKLVREKLGKGYVDAAPAKAAKRRAKQKGAAEGFPFLFFGRRPGDWASGSNMGHAYELRFASPPRAKARAAIAQAFETALADGPVRTSGAEMPWLWAGHWALFCVGEGAPRDADAFFDAMERALRAIHAVAPLAEVVFMGVRERGDGPWDRWSLEQQPGPSRDPHFGEYARHPDADYPDVQGGAPKERAQDGAADPEFEAARAKARGEAAPAPAASKKAPAAKGGKPALRAIAMAELPPDPVVPREIAAKLAEGTPVVLDATAAGARLALGVKPGSYGQETRSLFVGERGAKPTAIELPKGFYVAQALAPDGARAVVVNRQSGDVHELALPACTSQKVFTDPGTPVAAAYLDADRVALLTDAALFLLERAGKALRPAARLPLPDMTGMALAGPDRLAVLGEGKLRVIGAEGAALREVAKLATRAPVLLSRGGRVYLTDHRVPERRTAAFVLDGV